MILFNALFNALFNFLFYSLLDFILNCVIRIIFGFLGFVISYTASFLITEAVLNTNAIVTTSSGFYVNVTCDYYDKFSDQLVDWAKQPGSFIQIDCSNVGTVREKQKGVEK